MAEKVLIAKKRELGTQGAMNQLRKSGFVPGVYYLKGKDIFNFSVEEVVLNKLVFTAETNIIALTIEGEEPLNCIIKDIQFDPVTDRVVHFDLQGLTLGQTLQLEIPISFVGTAAGIKEGGILQELLHKLDVECLPRHIPQNLEIDVTDLALGDSIHVRDLEFENIKILNSDDSSVASVILPRVEEDPDAEEEDDEASEMVEPEVVSKGKVDED
ncbi:MAG: 50S ribosomal protein L25 [Melioribacteraceae bacterium]|jgi:large subunit ribosomal protein L25|nr:50S ribosomal protein L25 [Melioribacteraceae bacterium]